MSTFLLTALVICAAGICVEGYFILGNQQRTQTTNEQILASSIENRRLLETNMRLLGLHPSKSADPTTAPEDAPAYVPYAGLREELGRNGLADSHGAFVNGHPSVSPSSSRSATANHTAGDDRWADDGGPEPARGPDTRPAAAVLIDHAFDEAETGPIPVVRDSADEALARFTFQGGRRP